MIGSARVATLGTVRRDGSPHLVPCVFAPAQPLVYLPIDAKPKRTRSLARLANLDRDPRAVLLFDGWDEDWSRLWWVRFVGRARVLDRAADMDQPRRLLLARYAQYATPEELHPIIEVRVDSWTGWSTTDEDQP